MANSSPNILVVVADQLTPGALPVYGNSVVRAPHFERLAAQGVVFDSAYCNSPLCAPSRYGLLSGRLPSRVGAFDNASEFSSEVPTVAHHLRHAGYQTILSGKMHFAGPNQLHGFEERLTTDIYPADFGWTPDWDSGEARQSWYHNMSSVIQAGPCIRTNQLDFDEEVVFKAQRKLFDLARQPAERPFFMVVSLTHPHDPYVIPQEYWDLYRDDEIDLPRIKRADVADDPHSARLRQACEIDRTPPTELQVRHARRAYYGAISYVDTQLGRLLDTLEKTGKADNTIVVVTSDHGDMLGERGLWYKMNFFEGAARVPLIVSAPGRFQAGRVGQSVSLVDLLPTFVDLANEGAAAALPPEIEGRSLLPHLQGQAGHDEVFAEYMAEGTLAPMVMIRRGAYKFIHSPADPDLLFDLASDPDECRNLAGEPAHAQQLADLRAEAARRWDLPGLHQRILASQRQRRFLFQAESLGRAQAWDWQPQEDASRQYIRRHLDLDTLEAMARYPAYAQPSPAAGGNELE